MCLAQLLEAHRAERRYAEHCAVSRGRGGNRAFALMVEEALQCSRRAIDRQGQLLAHDSDREINSLDAPQHVGHEIAVLEACRIAPMGHLVVGRSIDVVEDRARQPSPRQSTKIVKVVAVAEAHGRLRSSCGRLLHSRSISEVDEVRGNGVRLILDALPPTRPTPQSERRSEPSRRSSTCFIPRPLPTPAQGFQLPNLYSGARSTNRITEGFLLRRLHLAVGDNGFERTGAAIVILAGAAQPF